MALNSRKLSTFSILYGSCALLILNASHEVFLMNVFYESFLLKVSKKISLERLPLVTRFRHDFYKFNTNIENYHQHTKKFCVKMKENI